MPMKTVGGPQYRILKDKATVPSTYFQIRLAPAGCVSGSLDKNRPLLIPLDSFSGSKL